ncbi:MAG: DUF1338 domain-containing protein [Candidatus Omnitrophota bacterium]
MNKMGEEKMKNLDDLLKALWDDYAGMNKQAMEIHQLLQKRGEVILNDHIAFRTFNIKKVGIDAVAAHFTKHGYQASGEYEFPSKKLFAKHFEHKDPQYPRVFISELKLEECSPYLKETIEGLVDQVSSKAVTADDFPVSGRIWKSVSYDTYHQLKEESEYAGWMSVFGFRANHFTVLFNALKTFKDLQDFNKFIKNSGYPLNASGGEIKGSPQEFLEQSSTLAHQVEVKFSDQTKTIPACYYEFARRYPLPNGKLFSGFVAQSADKIFESTDNKKKSV